MTKIARTHEKKDFELPGVAGGRPVKVSMFVKREKPLPVGHFKTETIRTEKGAKKAHVLQAAKEKIAAMGGTFLSYNRKKQTCHYINNKGNKVAQSVYLG